MDFFDSAEGQTILRGAAAAAEGAMEPYRLLVQKSYPMTSSQRREFFRETKRRMGRTEWVGFVGYCEGTTKLDLHYMAVWSDVAHVDREGR